MDEKLIAKLKGLGGRLSSREETSRFTQLSGDVPHWFLRFMEDVPIANAALTLRDSDDESGLGVEMRWMTVDNIIDEATNAYPSLSAIRHGFLPVGMCLLGTGDPYFVDMRDKAAAVYRIPHTAIGDGDELVLNQIERVSSSLMSFLNAVDLPVGEPG